MKFEIRDWAHNLMFNGQTFDSYDDAWAFIYENIPDENNAYDEVFVKEVSA